MVPRHVALAFVLVLKILEAEAQACDGEFPSLMELYASSPAVLEVRVLEAPPMDRAGTVRMQVLQTLKGAAPSGVVEGRVEGSDCDASPSRGTRAFVFLDPAGHVSLESYAFVRIDPRRDDPAKLARALVAWGRARGAGDRVQALVDLVEGGGGFGAAAGDLLLARPDLLNALDQSARDRLLGAAGRPGRAGPPVAAILARVRDPRVPTLLRGGWRPGGDAARVLLRSPSFEHVTDRAELARTIEHQRPAGVAPPVCGADHCGSPDDDLAWLAAFERCERLAGVALSPLDPLVFWYAVSGTPPDRARLAAACRTATPVRD